LDDLQFQAKPKVSGKDFMNHNRPEAALRLSSTLLMVRDRSSLEVLMVARNYEIDFASGALVFPGGKVCADDHDPRWADLTDGGFQGEERALRVAAIREAFEESGLLAARTHELAGPTACLVGEDQVAPLRLHRAAIDRGEASFCDHISKAGLVLALDRLVPFAHWITPKGMPKRFDTHFYLMQAPEGQVESHDGREAISANWLDPAEALESETAGKTKIIFPTRLNLVLLSKAKSAAEALELARSRQLVTVEPEVRQGASGLELVIPEAAGYGITTEPLTARNT
jgi:8-oxo-dGTP pyrophosphatase MutT (NUDIX family)